LQRLVKARLSVMMFLEFFVWGGWFVTMGSYLAANLGATGAQSASAYSTQSWGAIVAPFFVGLIADRYVNAEKLLGAIHLIGAVLMFQLSRAQQFDHFYPYLLAYMILYMPTLALVNSIAMRALEDPRSHFAKIRLWGTIGWIVAGLMISYVFAWDARDGLAEGMLRNTFLMCSVVSTLLGLYSFTLPRTPPAGKSVDGRATFRQALGSEAFNLLRDRNFLVFFVTSMLICIPLAFYYQHANQFLTEIGVANAAGKQTLGQASEVLFMLAVPFFLKRVGMKWTLLMGMLAWAVRYVLFAFGDAAELAAFLLIGIALHGACYDFFFVAGQIYTDSQAGERYRSSAQGLITLATYGVGMLVGFQIAGAITDAYVNAGIHDWHRIWLFPAGIAALIFFGFALSFKNVVVEYKREQGNAIRHDPGTRRL
jgi:nucleoside transporter